MDDKEYRSATLHQDIECHYLISMPPKELEQGHEFCEILFFLQGNITYRIGNKTYKVRKHDLAFIDAGVPHYPVAIPYKTYKRVVIWVKADFLRRLSTPETDLAECFQQGKREVIVALDEQEGRELLQYTTLLSNSVKEGYGADVEKNCLAGGIFLFLNRKSREKRGTILRSQQANRNRELVEYIQQNYGEELMLDSLAAMFHVSKYHFVREFRKEYGMGIHQFICKTRLSAACRMIQEGESVTLAARRCGFNEYSSFLKAFKQEYGSSPRDYILSVMS